MLRGVVEVKLGELWSFLAGLVLALKPIQLIQERNQRERN
jgi:hypothetical protein